MEEKIKVAVLGVGNIGFHHTRIYSGLENVELIGIYDQNEELVQRVSEQFQTKAYASFSDILALEPHAISICIPTHFHFEYAKIALEKGIHCLVEKPMATNLSEIQELSELAYQNECVLTSGHVERFNPAVLKMKELIDEGVLGDIVHLNAKRVGGYPPQLTQTGVYFDLAVHDLDIILYLIDKEPEKVSVNRFSLFNNEVDDAASAHFKFDNADATIQVNWITPVKIRTLAITGTNGYAELNFIDQSIDLFARNADPDNFTEKDFQEFLHKFSNIEKVRVEIEKQEPLKNELNHFINVIKGNADLIVTPNQIFNTMKWLQYEN